MSDVVDLDAGEGWGAETYDLKRPFRFKGQVYTSIDVRIPSGADVERRIRGDDPMREMRALAEDLTQLPAQVFAAMYAADRAGILTLVGKHMSGARDA